MVLVFHIHVVGFYTAHVYLAKLCHTGKTCIPFQYYYSCPFTIWHGGITRHIYSQLLALLIAVEVSDCHRCISAFLIDPEFILPISGSRRKLICHRLSLCGPTSVYHPEDIEIHPCFFVLYIYSLSDELIYTVTIRIYQLHCLGLQGCISAIFQLVCCPLPLHTARQVEGFIVYGINGRIIVLCLQQNDLLWVNQSITCEDILIVRVGLYILYVFLKL